MDRFDAMQAFARVVEAGSFTKAAQTLHMSRTTVTQLVQQLEARLRVKLLHRTTRRVQATADGAAYYQRVARLLLIPALPVFHARYPDIQLDMGVSDRRVDMVGDNVDCVVRGGAITGPSLVARQVGALRLRVFAAPEYLQHAGTPEHPRVLEDSHHRTVGFLWERTGRPVPCAMRRGGESLHARIHGPTP